ncbi:MAG: hypothetical protein WCC04_14015 [Terriglobales bacterium]
MSRRRITNTAWTLAYLATGVLFISFAAQAGTLPEAGMARGIGFAYDATKEITVAGTVKGFVSQPSAGSPAGSHLLISSNGQTVDVHLGPYVSRENQQALHAGQLAQVIGVRENVHGKKVLLARQLIFNGRLVTVRNERGFLVRNLVPGRKNGDAKHAGNGGIQ